MVNNLGGIALKSRRHGKRGCLLQQFYNSFLIRQLKNFATSIGWFNKCPNASTTNCNVQNSQIFMLKLGGASIKLFVE